MTPKEKQDLLLWSCWGIDKSLDDDRPLIVDRHWVIEKLGEMRHIAAIPPLLAVIRDQSDQSLVPRGAVVALSEIPHPMTVDYLIEFLSDAAIAWPAQEQLIKITHIGIGRNDPQLTATTADGRMGDGRVLLQRRWRAWWSKHRGSVKLDTAAARVSEAFAPEYIPGADE
ncbi:MAG: HEAT repeat domain-containing protein [Pirellulales bacterium]|nr:HEAT repeat domain-containing protein [Pirellulales bacterium]